VDLAIDLSLITFYKFLLKSLFANTFEAYSLKVVYSLAKGCCYGAQAQPSWVLGWRQLPVYHLLENPVVLNLRTF